MQQQTVVNPKYEALRKSIEAIPEHFGEGRLLYAGRNEIRECTVDGQPIAAKRFKKLDPIKKFIYTFFRADKAFRSYSNGMELLHRGISTPEPIAYIKIKKNGLIDELYYLCAETKARDIKGELIDKQPYNGNLLKAYAKFVAVLHEKGIYHRDLNPTNVLYEEDGKGGYNFTLIDINRMTFFDGPVPKDCCMENLTQFWWLTPVYRAVLDEYAVNRGWTKADIDKAIHVKEVHDRHWVRRKNFTAIFKRIHNS